MRGSGWRCEGWMMMWNAPALVGAFAFPGESLDQGVRDEPANGMELGIITAGEKTYTERVVTHRSDP